MFYGFLLFLLQSWRCGLVMLSGIGFFFGGIGLKPFFGEECMPLMLFGIALLTGAVFSQPSPTSNRHP